MEESSRFFDDGIRSIDYVLVWKKNYLQINEEKENQDSDKIKKCLEEFEKFEMLKKEKRRIFEQNLLNEGLELEIYTDEDFNFVKVHAPLEVLRRYAEILKLRLPMKKIPGITTISLKSESIIKRTSKKFLRAFFLDAKHFPPISQNFTAVYSRDKEYLFDMQQSNFFNSWVRARVCQFILDRQRFSADLAHDFSFGIERLTSDETYIAAYALHDGEILSKNSKRYLLYHHWSSLKKIFYYQPLDYIKEYFGVKIAIYFAWLGYYTYMLVLASIAGLINFFYSIRWMRNNTISEQVCDDDPSKQFIMCPLCDIACDYYYLSTTCFQTQIRTLFDNLGTVIFAIFMSFWAALFLENWKRYSAEITHRWDLTGFDIYEENPRPQYLAWLKSIKRRKKNFVTNASEPNVPFWKMKLPATILSVSVVLLLIALALAAVIAIVLYRISVSTSLSFIQKTNTSFNILFTTSTAAIINLILIVVMNFAYEYLSEWLTELELLRTQTQFDDSLTLKIYLLQFINYYASIFYIAFIKGKIIGTPGNYTRFGRFRHEECGVGGCLLELFIQLAIIMIGKQTVNACVEILWPIIMQYYHMIRLSSRKQHNALLESSNNRYINDLKLIEFGSRGLFPEYLEMVLQYGFITIFVAAFPLAPFFALLNNIFEMRLDAKKLLVYYRRPIFARVQSIGIWYRILDGISKLSVITNGFIIAFTSDFIPRLVYVFFYSPDKNLNGYVNFTLSYFETSKLTHPPEESQYSNITECRYQDYRNPPGHPKEYHRNVIFWNITAARLLFVVLFENMVAIVMLLVRWLIPDKSASLRNKIRREAYITNEIIIQHEASRSGKAEETDVENSEKFETFV